MERGCSLRTRLVVLITLLVTILVVFILVDDNVLNHTIERGSYEKRINVFVVSRKHVASEGLSVASNVLDVLHDCVENQVIFV